MAFHLFPSIVENPSEPYTCVTSDCLSYKFVIDDNPLGRTLYVVMPISYPRNSVTVQRKLTISLWVASTCFLAFRLSLYVPRLTTFTMGIYRPFQDSLFPYIGWAELAVCSSRSTDLIWSAELGVWVCRGQFHCVQCRYLYGFGHKDLIVRVTCRQNYAVSWFDGRLVGNTAVLHGVSFSTSPEILRIFHS